MGMLHLKQNYPRLNKMMLRPEFRAFEFAELGTAKGRGALVVRGVLQLYRMSDLINVYSTASAGLVGWDVLEARMRKGEITDKEIQDILWRGKKGMKLDDLEVMNKNRMESNLFKGVISKPVSLSVIEFIRKGKMEDAKKMYLQYLVNLTQWRYGPGGTPGLLRNSIVRGSLMYWSWWMNYTDFLTRASRPDMLTRYGQWAATEILIASMLMGMGYKAWRWLLAGPLPSKFMELGPLATMAEQVYNILRGSLVRGTAEIIPGVPEEEKEAMTNYVSRQWDDLWGF
jgi:hypothetical protein